MRTMNEHFRAFLAFFGVALAAGVLTMVYRAEPARAAFPGTAGAIAFQSLRSGSAQIYRGRKIAFVRWQIGSDAEIWRMRADGTNQVQLTDNTAEDQSPSWQPIP